MTAGQAAFSYHLWLVPEGDARRHTQAVIDRLARTYCGPEFTPHITLLSGLRDDEASLIEANRALAARFQPFTLNLLVPEAGTSFFQCIYMRVSEDPMLLGIRQAAARAFSLPADGYMPHLSLYYGDVSAERRAEILAAVPAQAKCCFSVESIQLIRAESERPIDWHCVDAAPMGDSAAGTDTSS